MQEKKNILTYEGLRKYEDELHDLQVVKRQEVAQKIKEAREQGDLSENAEYDAAKDEQRDIEARIEELEKILKNAEVVVEDEVDLDKINIGCQVKILDIEYSEELDYKIVGSTEANSLKGKISNESPVGKALIGHKVGDTVEVETPAGVFSYKIQESQRSNVEEVRQSKEWKKVADTQNTNVQEQDIHQLLKVKREKLANLQQAGKDPFQITKYDVTHHSTDIKNNFEELEGKTVRIAGRVMSKRVMGKASFCNVQDLPGNIQVYVARDSIGEESYADFKKYDVGDIVGIEGEVFKTKTGEISVHASQVILLSKSLQILPEKFHGLTNTDIRYRQRYTDLIMNQDVKDTFVKRSKIISAIRRYLDGQGFLEVETPMLVSNAGGAAARPFETHYNALDEDVKLRISLELYLKRLIVGCMERVFEIGRVFRNEGLDTRHNPEFTLMELYQAYTDYYGMMDLTENMFRYVAQEVCGTTVIPYAEETIDLGKPFERLTMVDAVKKYAGVDFDQIPDTAAAKKLADEKGVHYEERHAKGDILNLFFEEFVEEHLIQPVFIMDHPVEISPLTKRKPDKPDYVERFELFIYGREMCNAYSELNDPIDQRERFKAQEAALAAGDEEANTTDEDFMNALEIGMPPTGGIGYGIDRLVMLLTNSPAIRDVLLFPTMKSLS